MIGTRDTFAAMVDAGEIPADRYVGVLRGDATRLPFADGAFDAVVTSEVLEHIPDDVARHRRAGARAASRAGCSPPPCRRGCRRRSTGCSSDEYHAPAAVGGHVRIYSATELKAKLRAAGLRLAGSHHAHALHSPYWWLKCAVGVNDDDHPLVRRYRQLPRVGHHRAAARRRGSSSARLSPVLGKSLVLYAVKQPVATPVEQPLATIPASAA